MVPAGGAVFLVDASLVVRWLTDGPFGEECRALLRSCAALDAWLLAPTVVTMMASFTRPPVADGVPGQARSVGIRKAES